MNQKYTPQEDRLVPIPIVEEPKFSNSLSGFIGEATASIIYERNMQAYKAYKELPCPLIINEKDFKQGEEYELNVHFKIKKEIIINAPGERLVAVPIQVVTDKGVEQASLVDKIEAIINKHVKATMLDGGVMQDPPKGKKIGLYGSYSAAEEIVESIINQIK